jgi:hypothetical protein
MSQQGGGTDEENDINTIFDATQHEVALNAGRLLTQQEQKFNQNHWKIAPPQKFKPQLAQLIVQRLTYDRREALLLQIQPNQRLLPPNHSTKSGTATTTTTTGPSPAPASNGTSTPSGS